MADIKQARFAGLFSYSEESEIEFSDRMVIVGPNNSGKSNIIRILNLFVETFSKGRLLRDEEISAGGVNPFLEITLELSKKETEKIIQLLSFYPLPPNNNSQYYDYPNKEFLVELFNKISIKLSWKREIHPYGSTPYLELEFEKIGLKISGNTHVTYLVISNTFPSNPDITPSRSDIKLHEILSELSDKEDPKEAIAKIFGSKPNEFLHIGTIQYNQSNLVSDKEKLAFAELYSYAGLDLSSTQLSLVGLLGKIFQRCIQYTKGRISMYDLLDLVSNLHSFGNDDFDAKLRERATSYLMEHTDQLASDGNNLPQFLFHLKNSPNFKESEKFRRIQDAFNQIYQSEELTIDAVLEYEKIMQNVIWDTKKPQKPKRPVITISDKKLGKRFPLDQVGAGLAEIIYLLSACYGIENSIIMLDEPSVNLHPTMMKSLMKYIENPENNNQFLIITHSVDLLHYELFDGNAEIFYVRRTNQHSKIKSLKDELKLQFKTDRPRLKHQIQSSIFFAKCIILVEGDSDKNLLNGISQYLGYTKKELDVEGNDVIITSVDGKDNFRKYRDLLDAFEIPYVLLADSDAKNLFDSHGTVTKEGITGSKDIAVIENKNLEQLMRDIDSKTYSKIEKEIGNSKPTVAYLFAQDVLSKDPDALKSLTPLLLRAIEKSRM